jgi:Uma2 family endonuclease
MLRFSTMGQLEPRPRPLRRAEYERMISVGLFQDERIELIRGALIEMSPQNLPHANSIQVLTALLVPPLVGRAAVRVQLPFNASDDSVPEPDVALVDPVPRRDAHPDRAFLIIEVSNDSLRFDRKKKAPLYARAGVPEYWIVNLVDRVIERRSEPVGAAYATLTLFRPGESVAPLAFPDVPVQLAEIFGD